MGILETALRLAEAGIFLTPVLSAKSKQPGAGKRPIMKAWQKNASSDPGEIRAWFERDPNINIGVVMGKSKIFCLDVDPRNGGLEWLDQHREAILGAKNCVIEETGRGDGGLHAFYLVPEGFELPKSVKVPGLDLLTGGKQVIVAPSVHPATMKPNRLISENSLFNIRKNVPEIPDCVKKLLSKTPSVRKKKRRGKSVESEEEDASGLGPPTDLSVIQPITEEERLDLKFELALLDPNVGRHQAIGGWIINAVACQMPDDEIHQIATDWLSDFGREEGEQPFEVVNWIRDAKKGLTSGKYQPSCNYRPERLLDVLPIDEESLWLGELDRTTKGVLKKSRKNVIDILMHDRRIAGVFAFNLHAQSVGFVSAPPWEPNRAIGAHGDQLVDSDLVFCSDWIAREYRVEVSAQMMLEAVEVVSRRNNYHPIQERIQKVVWDKKPRLETVFQDYFGAEGKPKYLAACARSLFIGGVARAFKPGCKHDQMVIIEGGQGIRKSTAIAIIGGDFYADDLGGEIGQKDVVENIRNCWCIEQAELDHLTRAETNRFKAFLSRREDRARLSYGRLTQVFPRQCFFVGTTNSQDYLRDATGGRRFLPVPCWGKDQSNPIDTDGLQEVIDQLWAEAFHLFKSGKEWWVTEDVQKLAEEMQASRQQEDVIEEKIMSGLNGDWDPTGLDGKGKQLDAVTIPKVWETILGGDIVHCKQGDKISIGNILAKNGWIRKTNTRLDGSSPTTVYMRPEAQEVSL